jgi:DNA-binding transcriptional ArsR family regulator/protein-L-isoaspartate O-methyltransferase
LLDLFVATSKALADPLRVDVLRVLQRDSFGVLELAQLLGVPQPALSHHLKLLLEAGLLTKRRDGTSVYYRRAVPPTNGPLADYLSAALAVIDHTPLAPALQSRVKKIHHERGQRSRDFFRSHAMEFAEQQALICTPAVYLGAIEAAIERTCDGRRAALDVGVGEGQGLPLLSKRFARVLGVDESAAMLARARELVVAENLTNVALRHADVTEVRGRFDLVLMSMVVHHAAAPNERFCDAARLLAPRGILIVVELCTHAQAWTKEACGDVWLGFEPEELDGWAKAAGLDAGESEYLAQRNGFRIQIRSYRQSPLLHPRKENARESA